MNQGTPVAAHPFWGIYESLHEMLYKQFIRAMKFDNIALGSLLTLSIDFVLPEIV